MRLIVCARKKKTMGVFSAFVVYVWVVRTTLVSLLGWVQVWMSARDLV